MKKKIGNWFYYYKWYLAAAVIITAVLVRWAGNILGIFEKKADLQAAYIGRQPLSAETVQILEDGLASYAGDYNHDGTVKVSVHVYLSAGEDSTTEAQQSAAAAEIALAGDINDCESYIFLMEDPAAVQLDWQILAEADGSCPKPTDYTVENKVLPLSDLPLDLSGVTAEGDLLALGRLQVGRRCFYTDRTCRYPEDLDAFWKALTAAAGLKHQ